MWFGFNGGEDELRRLGLALRVVVKYWCGNDICSVHFYAYA